MYDKKIKRRCVKLASGKDDTKDVEDAMVRKLPKCRLEPLLLPNANAESCVENENFEKELDKWKRGSMRRNMVQKV